jgi:CYTH domain-containing protein
MEIELERTFLLKYKPEGLDKCKSVEIYDTYFPKEEFHPFLRLRNKDNKKFEMTKKFPINGKDSSEQVEHTIILSDGEYKELAKLDGKEVRKIRYYYELPNGQIAEVDIFKDKLEGLGSVDFEFKTKEEKEKFIAPDFCLAEVSQDKWLAGGMLAGGNYLEAQKFLEKYNYKKL